MNDRQQKILQFIVNHYIKTAQPVGSQLIVEKGKLPVSSATIRNEMAELEAAGLIHQPHTSAGRVPTENGYQFFVDHFVQNSVTSDKTQQRLRRLVETADNDVAAIKSIAKGLAELSTQAVFVGFEENNVYYTGLSNLFGQPEFAEYQLAYRLSKIIDHLDQAIAQLFDRINDDVAVLIGRHNPFGQDCSAIITRYRQHGQSGLVGILGPLRMDYQANITLVKSSQQFINTLHS